MSINCDCLSKLRIYCAGTTQPVPPILGQLHILLDDLQDQEIASILQDPTREKELIGAFHAAPHNVLNHVNEEGSSLAHFLAQFGSVELLEAFYHGGGNLEIQTNIRETPLYLACRRRDDPQVGLFIMSHTNEIDVARERGITPLHMAAALDNPTLAIALIKGGANVSSLTEAGRAPLHFAAETGSLSAVQTLCNLGANPQLQTKSGDTPLFLAAGNKEDPRVVFYLLMQVDKIDEQTIGKIISEKGIKEVRALVEKGVDLHQISPSGWTSLHHAAGGASLSVFKLLLENGLDIVARNDRRDLPIHVAALSEGQGEVLTFLIDQMHRMNLSAEDKTTLLCFTAAKHSPMHVQALLDRGCSLNGKDKEGMTPILYAAKLGNVAVVQHLLKAGADLDACRDSDKENILTFASHLTDSSTFFYLVPRLNSVNRQGLGGRTALHTVAQYKGPEEVELLLKAGANPHIKDAEGMTAFDRAQKNWKQKEEILKRLHQYTPPKTRLPVSIQERGEDLAFKTDNMGSRRVTRYDFDAKTNDLYPIDGTIRFKSVAIALITPFYMIGTALIQFGAILYDTARISLSTLKAFALHLKEGEFKASLKALIISVGYALPKVILSRIYRALISPFCSLALLGGSLTTLCSPHRGRIAMNRVCDIWQEMRFLKALGLSKIGNLSEKIGSHSRYQRVDS